MAPFLLLTLLITAVTFPNVVGREKDKRVTNEGVVRSLENKATAWMYGTHLLVKENKPIYALQSQVVSLEDFEGEHVQIEGTLVHKGLEGGPPLMEVKSLKAKGEDLPSTKSSWELRLEVKGESIEDPILIGMSENLDNTINPPTPPEPYVDWYIYSEGDRYYGDIVSPQDEYIWDIRLEVKPGQDVLFSWENVESQVPPNYSIQLEVKEKKIELRNRENYGTISLDEGIYSLQITAKKEISKIVRTKPATRITNTSAILNLSYDFTNSGDVRFKWRELGGSWNATDWNSKSGSGPYSTKISGLSQGTEYEFRAQGRDSDAEVKDGSILTFMTTSPSNILPNADYSYKPSDPETDEPISFDASASSDSDGTIKSYEWSFGDGTSAKGKTTTHSFSSTGEYTIILKVKDNAGEEDSISKTVSITSAGSINKPPTAGADGPYSVDENKSVKLDGTASSDPENESLEYIWTIINDPTGKASIVDNETSDPTFQAPTVDKNTEIRIRLKVSDENQNTAIDNTIIKIRDTSSEDFPWMVVMVGLVILIISITLVRHLQTRSKTSGKSNGL